METMKVSTMKKIIESESSIKAMCDVTFSDDLTINGFYVVEGSSGPFVLCPRKATKNGKWFDILKLSYGLKDRIEKVVLEEYSKL